MVEEQLTGVPVWAKVLSVDIGFMTEYAVVFYYCKLRQVTGKYRFVRVADSCDRRKTKFWRADVQTLFQKGRTR